MSIKNYTDNAYKIFIAIEHHKMENKYFIGIVQIRKNLQNNKITAITLGKSCKENATLEEAQEFFAQLVGSEDNRVPFDLKISSLPTEKRDVIYKHPYEIDNETQLIQLYKLYQNRIYKGKSNIQIQNIGMGKGLYLDDISKPVKLRIDFNEIKISTIAIMFCIDEVLKSQARNLINSVLALNE